MAKYLREYERQIACPLHTFRASKHKPYADSPRVVAEYIFQINDAIHALISEIALPLQLDVFFVSPDTALKRQVHDQMRGCTMIFNDAQMGQAISDEYSRRNGAVDGVADVFHFLSRNVIACRAQFP